MKKKSRLDVFLYEKGYFQSREKAKREIMAGNIFVNGSREDKPGYQITEEIIDGKLLLPEIKIKEKALRYVSRGALKLEKALSYFNLNFNGKIIVDIGASTGGFTDLALKNGAEKIYAIDVGYGQLDYVLRNDQRVVNMEKTNIRHLFDDGKNANLINLADMVLIDVSFISLRLVLPVASKLLKNNGEIIALIKPQFEAKKEQVRKGGIIKDPAIHNEVIEKTKGYLEENNLSFDGLIESPIKGAKGNTEFLMKSQKKARSE